MVKKRTEEGSRAKVADFGVLVEDSNFLNKLQTGVSQWVREIQKVTRLERDAGSGTALQEISFWVNLEQALYKTQVSIETSIST